MFLERLLAPLEEDAPLASEDSSKLLLGERCWPRDMLSAVAGLIADAGREWWCTTGDGDLVGGVDCGRRLDERDFDMLIFSLIEEDLLRTGLDEGPGDSRTHGSPAWGPLRLRIDEKCSQSWYAT
jgi:hypothetical protein